MSKKLNFGSGIHIAKKKEEDPGCSVSEAGDEPGTPDTGTTSRSRGLSPFKKFATGASSATSSFAPLSMMKSKFVPLSKMGRDSEHTDYGGASASMPMRSSDLTLANLQGRGAASTQIAPYSSDGSAASGSQGGRSKRASMAGSQSYESEKSAITSMSHETGGPVWDRADVRYSSEYDGQYKRGMDKQFGMVIEEREPWSPRVWPPPHPDEKIHIKRRKFAAGSGVVAGWYFLVVGATIGYIWRYFIYEVDEVQGYVGTAAMKEVQTRTETLLAPAFSVVRILSLSLQTGTSPMDYRVLDTLLSPQFQSSPVLSEVQVADSAAGSILVQPGTIHVAELPLSERSLLFRSDRANCDDLARSCALQPMKANISEWYEKATKVVVKAQKEVAAAEEQAFTLPVTWHGPVFLKGYSYATAWDVYYWNPSYSLVSRLSWTSNIVLRVVVNAYGLQDVVQEVEKNSLGKIYVCSESGLVLASSDMSQAVKVDLKSGAVNFRHIWEIEELWAPMLNEAAMQMSEATDFLFGWVLGTRVFVYPFELRGSEDVGRWPPSMGLKLRIILAVPRSALALQWLEILSPVCAVFGALPLVILLTYLTIEYVKYSKVRMRERRERRKKELLEEKELQAKIKAERMGKIAAAREKGKNLMGKKKGGKKK